MREKRRRGPYKFNPAHFDLANWAKWTAARKPVHFSLLGDSLAGKPYEAHHKKTYMDDKPLWLESETFASGFIDRMVMIDNRLHCAMTTREREILFAATVPMGRLCPVAERAAAAGCTPETLVAVRRKALGLLK